MVVVLVLVLLVTELMITLAAHDEAAASLT
jgi:hypothetical protein